MHDPDQGSLPLSGAERIARERERQIERFPAEHDAEHTDALVRAAIVYATPPHHRQSIHDTAGGYRPVDWPWGTDEYKPGDRVRELEKAGALIAAEIDRLLLHQEKK